MYDYSWKISSYILIRQLTEMILNVHMNINMIISLNNKGNEHSIHGTIFIFSILTLRELNTIQNPHTGISPMPNLLSVKYEALISQYL